MVAGNEAAINSSDVVFGDSKLALGMNTARKGLKNVKLFID